MFPHRSHNSSYQLLALPAIHWSSIRKSMNARARFDTAHTSWKQTNTGSKKEENHASSIRNVIRTCCPWTYTPNLIRNLQSTFTHRTFTRHAKTTISSCISRDGIRPHIHCRSTLTESLA